MSNTIDAVVISVTEDRTYYFFSDESYAKVEQDKGVLMGYPRPVEGNWRGLAEIFPPPYDCVFRRDDEDQYYFFKSDQCVRYTAGEGPDEGYPKNIHSEWNDLWEKLPGPYDTAFLWKNFYYFFKGNLLVKYAPGEGVVSGYQKGVWWDTLCFVFPPPYSAACPSARDEEEIYFFKGDEYARYREGEGADNTHLLTYPANTLHSWEGAWAFKDSSPIWLGSFTDNGPLVVFWQKEDREISTTNIRVGEGEALSLNLFYQSSTAALYGTIKAYEVIGLLPNEEATISIETVDGDLIGTTVVKTPPARDDTSPVDFVFGSCVDDSRNRVNRIPTLDNILGADEDPRFIIFCGDSSYYVFEDETDREEVLERGDMENPWRMYLRLFATRFDASVHDVVTRIPSMATWDDHDFGFGNATGETMLEAGEEIGRPLIEESTEVFRSLWANNYRNLSLQDPIYSSFRYGSVEFFLPDSRTFRNESNQQILGEEQLAELVADMKASDALVKVFVSSSQFLSKRHDAENYFEDAPEEREALIEAFLENEMSGRILILSGDVHFGEIQQLKEGESLELVEMTASPFLIRSNRDDVRMPETEEAIVATRVLSCAGDNLGRIRIEFVQNDNGVLQPRITMTFVNESGVAATIYKEGGGEFADGTEARVIWDENNELLQF